MSGQERANLRAVPPPRAEDQWHTYCQGGCGRYIHLGHHDSPTTCQDCRKEEK